MIHYPPLHFLPLEFTSEIQKSAFKKVFPLLEIFRVLPGQTDEFLRSVRNSAFAQRAIGIVPREENPSDCDDGCDGGRDPGSNVLWEIQSL